MEAKSQPSSSKQTKSTDTPNHNKLVKAVNKIVTAFLLTNKVDDEVKAAWNDSKMQKRLKKTIQTEKVPKPRGLKGSYLFFCDDERQKIKEEFAKKADGKPVPTAQITCELGRRWSIFVKSTDPEDLKRMERYNAGFYLEQDRYAEEKRMLNLDKPKKEPVMDNAYRVFAHEERSKCKQTFAEINAKWKTVDKESRKIYAQKAEDAKAKAKTRAKKEQEEKAQEKL